MVKKKKIVQKINYINGLSTLLVEKSERKVMGRLLRNLATKTLIKN